MRRRHFNRGKLSAKDEKLLSYFLLFIIGVIIIVFIVEWVKTHVLEFIIFLVSSVISIFLLYKYVPGFRNLFKRKFSTYGNINDEEIKKLIDIIRAMKTQDVRNEEDFEKQVYQRLDALNYRCERQARMGDRKIDIFVNSKIGLELKLADKSKNIQDLIGQVTVYKKYLNNILVVILDEGRVQELEEFVEMIQAVDKEKIAVVVIRGNINRYKKKEEYILVKKETSVND